MNQSKRPTYKLIIVDKQNTKNKTRAGALWDEGDWMSLKLSPGVVLNAADSERYYFNVSKINWDNEEYQPRSRATDPNGDIPPGGENDARDDNDIHF